MLRKIDCVMVRVPDLTTATAFYTGVLGLHRLWQDESSAGLGLPETDAEVVLHTMDLPADRGVHYLVDDVLAAVADYRRQGFAILEAPFRIPIGWCAVLADPFGNTLCILDMTTGPRSAG